MKAMALTAAFLEENLEAFCVFMSEHGAGAGTSKDVLEELRSQAAPTRDRLCPHNAMHDRLRASFGYVRDYKDGDRSVCALCWLENLKDNPGRFHSPHGSILVMLFAMQMEV